jgi:glucosamine-phosphate N-acetyltransferase
MDQVMDLVVRELYGSDLPNGFLDTLSHLAEVGLTVERAGEVLRERLRTGVRTYIAMFGEQVVGTAALLLEQKFIHGGGYVGHIEDVVVLREHAGKGIGRALVEHALKEARKSGCYKVILNCHEKNVPFYEKLGFRRHEMEMRLDF